MKKHFLVSLFLAFSLLIITSGISAGKSRLLLFKSSHDSTRKHRPVRFILLPALIKSPETSWGFGAASSAFFKTRGSDTTIRTSNIENLGLYTLKHQLLIVLGANVYFPREKYIYKSQNSFSSFPDKFWGLGNYSRENNKESYAYKQFYLLQQFQKRLYRKFYAGVLYELQNVFSFTYQHKGIFDRENVTGRKGGLVSAIGFNLAWDNRNNAFSSSRGSFIQLAFSKFNRYWGSDYNFSIINVDIRKYIRTYSSHVFAFQVLANFSYGNTPIRNLSAMGGPYIMRGYYMGRYRDKNLIAAQAEYRLPIWKRIGMVVFGGLGEVSHHISDFSLYGLKYSLGGGLRVALKEKEKLNLRIDAGMGYHSRAIYLIVTEAF